MLKATDLVPDSNDYLKDLGSRRNRKIESKPKDDIMDVDDYEGEFLNFKSSRAVTTFFCNL